MTGPEVMTAPDVSRTTAAWLEIDVDTLAHNVGVIRAAVPAGTEVGILVKANGYGHGLELAARAAVDGGADRLIVATLDEALAIRALGIEAPVLVVYPVPVDGLADASEAGVALTVSGADSTARTVRAWRQAAAHEGRRLELHLEVDSGMARGGAAPEHAADAARAIASTDGLVLAGTWSHLANGADRQRTAIQVARFETALAAIRSAGVDPGRRHLAATEGLFAATAPPYDLVRIGLAFYGEVGLDVEVAPHLAGRAPDLGSALALRARPGRVETIEAGTSVGYGGEWTAGRPSRIATVPVGYADGWPRHASRGGVALVRGRRVPVVGRVSMDSIVLDVTDVAGVTADDVVTLIGRDGDARIGVADVARHRGTIPNEVFATLGARLPRVAVRALNGTSPTDRKRLL